MEENEKYQQARNLYFQTDLTQEQIASMIGISTRTLYRWMKQNEWKRIKQAARHAPAALVERLYVQLQDLNDSICSREHGKRVPTFEEAEINRKIIYSLSKLKNQATLSESLQVMMNFTTWLMRTDADLAQKVIPFADRYLTGEPKNFRQPWEMEYECDDLEEEEDLDPEPAQPEPEPVGPLVDANTFDVTFERCLHQDKIDDLPEEPGIYVVYEAFERQDELCFNKTLFVAGAGNIKQAVKALIPGFSWKRPPRGHTSLYITHAKFSPANIQQVTAALINGSHPLNNNGLYKDSFPFHDTTIRLSGHYAFFEKTFTVKQKASIINIHDTNKTQ